MEGRGAWCATSATPIVGAGRGWWGAHYVAGVCHTGQEQLVRPPLTHHCGARASGERSHPPHYRHPASKPPTRAHGPGRVGRVVDVRGEADVADVGVGGHAPLALDAVVNGADGVVHNHAWGGGGAGPRKGWGARWLGAVLVDRGTRGCARCLAVWVGGWWLVTARGRARVPCPLVSSVCVTLHTERKQGMVIAHVCGTAAPPPPPPPPPVFGVQASVP